MTLFTFTFEKNQDFQNLQNSLKTEYPSLKINVVFPYRMLTKEFSIVLNQNQINIHYGIPRLEQHDVLPLQDNSAAKIICFILSHVDIPDKITIMKTYGKINPYVPFIDISCLTDTERQRLNTMMGGVILISEPKETNNVQIIIKNHNQTIKAVIKNANQLPVIENMLTVALIEPRRDL